MKPNYQCDIKFGTPVWHVESRLPEGVIDWALDIEKNVKNQKRSIVQGYQSPQMYTSMGGTQYPLTSWEDFPYLDHIQDNLSFFPKFNFLNYWVNINRKNAYNVKINMSPNQATFIRLITIIVSYYLVCIGENLIGYILIYMALIIDCVDGQLARVLDKASYFGKFFDGWVDCIFEITFPLVIAFSLYQVDEDKDIFIYGILAGLMNALYWITLFRYSINKPYFKKYYFSKVFNHIFNYMDNRLLVDWFDLKYFIFPIFLLFNILDSFILLLCVANTFLFIIFSLERLYRGYYYLNSYKKSMSSKT